MQKVPVLFLVFNRPDLTAQTLEAIKSYAPNKLYVAADGPRHGREDDVRNNQAVKEIILNNVTWDCEVITLYRDINLGCKQAVSEGITWFFQQEEAGIIIEDDCVTDSSFFVFAAAMLQRYFNDSSVAHIGALNAQHGLKVKNGDYYFSRYCHIWGWATWRRSWQLYDIECRRWPAYKYDGLLETCHGDHVEWNYWSKVFQDVYDNKIDTWDYQWTLTVWMNGLKAIVPQKNLVNNVGFRDDATHTTSNNKAVSKLIQDQLEGLRAPSSDKIQWRADKRTFYNLVQPHLKLGKKQKLKKFILNLIGSKDPYKKAQAATLK